MSHPLDKGPLLAVGQVVGVFGVKGWLKIKSFTQPEENLFQYKPWFLSRQSDGSQAQAVHVDGYESRPQGFVAHLHGLDDRDEAAGHVSQTIFVPSACLPSLQEGDYYWHQLVGLTVYSIYAGQRRCLGRVSGFLETGANDVMVVEGHGEAIDRRERLIPYVPGQYVTQVDLPAGEVLVDWDPEF